MSSAFPEFRTALPVLMTFLAIASAPLRAHALVIDPTFGIGVGASAQSAFNYAAGQIEALFSDPVTVNITVEAGSSGLGSSTTSLKGTYSYSTVRGDLIADQTAHPSADGAASVGAGGSLFSTSAPSGASNFWLTTAQAKALGALAANDAASDGTFTYNSTLAYTFDPNNRAVPGAFDFIGVAEHEITEIMGRITLNGATLDSRTHSAMAFDLFSFTGVGAHTLTTGASRYFSIDNGTDNLHGYNFPNGNGSDPQDWDASLANDPFNASTGSNQAHVLNATDIATLDVIGWDYVGAVPEPASKATLLAGLALVGAAALRRRGTAAD
jgi:hypothetical protein